MDFSYQLSLTPRLLGWNALALKCIQFPDNEDFCEEAKLASLQCRLQLLGIELRIIVAVNSSLSQSTVHSRSQQFIVAVNCNSEELSRFIVAVNSLPAACHSVPSHWKL